MKALPKLLILSAVLAFAGCGKNNESGKSSNRGVCLQYNVNGACSAYSSGTYVSGNNINLSGFLSQIPCEMGMNGYPTAGGRTQQTIRVQTNSLATRGQSYLGITSLGDIAIVTGDGTHNPPMTVFLCPGQVMGQLTAPVLLGEFTTATCPIKTITAATLANGYTQIRFRDPRFGRGTTGQPFSFCR